MSRLAPADDEGGRGAPAAGSSGFRGDHRHDRLGHLHVVMSSRSSISAMPAMPAMSPMPVMPATPGRGDVALQPAAAAGGRRVPRDELNPGPLSLSEIGGPSEVYPMGQRRIRDRVGSRQERTGQ